MPSRSPISAQPYGPRFRAFVHGVVAFLITVAVVFALVAGRVADALTTTTITVGGDPVTLAGALVVAPNLTPGWKLLGWLFYGAHLVPIEHYQLALQFGISFLPVLLVPPLVLALAGAYRARDRPHATSWDSGVHGAALVTGYLPLAVLGGLLVQVDTGGSLLGTGPSMLFVIVYGTLYPLVWAGAGAILVHNRRGTPQPTGDGADQATTDGADQPAE